MFTLYFIYKIIIFLEKIIILHKNMNDNNLHNKYIGNKGEDIAEGFLLNKGYEIVERNFRFGKEGEIDIIVSDRDTLIFVEVKTRTNHKFGNPILSITEKKKRQMRFAANGYMLKNNIVDGQCRIDVVTIDMVVNPPEITHLENAF